MRNEEVIKLLMEQVKRSEEQMDQVVIGIKQMNDTNMLHTKTLDILTTSIQANNKITEENKNSINQFLNFNKYIYLLLIIAIIVLAGAKQALEFFS